jgi:RHS repeat-associated protein
VTQIANSAAGVIAYTHDLLDRPASVTAPEGIVSYTYDVVGRRATMTVSGQQPVGYAYDDADRLTTITQGTSTVAFAYDAADRRTSLTLPNGIVTDYQYDAGSQLTSLTYRVGATMLGDLTYTYDAAGRRTSVGGTWARTMLPAPLASATYDAANQIATWGGVGFTYDANGNLTSDATKTYTWNARNQLAGISGGVTAGFTYGADGQRASRSVGGSATAFLYDGLNPVQELSGGVPTANLLTGLGIDEYFRRTDASGSRHFLVDALGSSVALSDDTAAIQTSYTYSAFGDATTTGTASANTQTFTGGETDGTGLYYYRARYYDPKTQRFISEDPIELSGGDVNLYAYVGNSPQNDTDPLGLASLHAPVPAMCLPPGVAGRKDPPVALPDSLREFLCDPNNGLPFPGALGTGIGRSAAGAGARALGRRVGHHAWPKYLGGKAKQELARIPRWLHERFHAGLDKILPRQWGSEYFKNLSPAARKQMLQELADYVRAFDAKYGTNLYESMLRNGFPNWF